MIFYIIGIFKLLADMLYDFAHILNTFEGLYEGKSKQDVVV